MSNPPVSLNTQFERMCFEKCIPLYATFELTYKCNLRCRHCYIQKDYNNELSLSEIEPILDQLVQIGTMTLTFTGGEIFVRKDLLDILKTAKSKGFILILMTNGTFITTENVDEIAKLKPKEIHISLYGARAETHDFVTTVSGSFERTVSAIKLLAERGVSVVAKTVLMNSNVKEHKDIEVLSRSLGATPRIQTGIVPRKDGSLLPLRHDLSFEDAQSYFAEKSDMNVSPETPLDPARRLMCKAGKSLCSVSPDGGVFSCLMMPKMLGSLREQTMKEIWYQKGDEFLDKLRSPTAYKSSPCFTCDLLKFCSRCSGVAYIETGDPFGRSPSACQRARWQAQRPT